MKKQIAIIFSLFFIAICISQTLTQTVKGKILDSQTDFPIAGANVVLLNEQFKIGSVSDFDGNFIIENIPVGRASFLFSYVGYEDFVVREIVIGSAKQVNLTIHLVEELGQLDEVIIKSKKNRIKTTNKSALVSAKSFSVEETKRFPASVSDPGRMALSFAGVTNSDDTTNEIIIRGNAPNQLLWRIEGVEVPDPNHFVEEGSSTGAISLISSNMLAKSDFFTGAFPAEYGNAISGVFDINLRNGNNSKKEYAFQFGVLGTDLTLEGPFSKNYKGSYLLNYRYSTLTLLNQIVEITDGSVPTFQDLAIKLNFPLGRKTNFSIWAIGGLSEDVSDEENDGIFIENENYESNTILTGATLSHFFNDNNKLETRLSFSGNDNTYFNKEEEIGTVNNEIQQDNFKNNAFRISADYTKKFNPKTSLKTGLIYNYIFGSFVSFEKNNGEAIFEIDRSENTTLLQTYAQINHRFNKKLTSSFGFHVTDFKLNNNTLIEPRFGLEYKIAPKHSLSFGYGIHSRRMPLRQYFTEVLDENDNIKRPNKNINLMQATHYIIGYDWRIIKNGHLKVEAYFQDLSNVAIVKDINNTDSVINGELIEEELIDNGKAQNIGLELTFEKFFSNQYYFLITTSIFDSSYRASNNKWFDSRYNYNYAFNLVGGKEFTTGKNKNNSLGINAKLLTNGGKRGTPIDLTIFEETGKFRINQALRNTTQFDEYFRIDASFYFRLNRKKTTHVFSLDFQNATNHQNVASQFLNPETGNLNTDYQLGLIPFINYKIEF
jgi:uncharacterized lipoprotein YajG